MILVNADGTLALPQSLQEALAQGDTANLYVICNNGITWTADIVSLDTLAAQKADANAIVDDFLSSQPSSLYNQALALAQRVRALIEAAASPEEIFAALKLLDTKLDDEQEKPSHPSYSTGSSIVTGQDDALAPADPSPAPPQTGSAGSIAPFLCLLAAAALFLLSWKKRSC